MLTRAIRPVARIARTGTRQAHGHGETKPFRYATMDDAPVPQGSWKEYYDKKQKLYNLQLAGGILVLAAGFATAKGCGALYLNWGPPNTRPIPHYYD